MICSNDICEKCINNIKPVHCDCLCHNDLIQTCKILTKKTEKLAEKLDMTSRNFDKLANAIDEVCEMTILENSNSFTKKKMKEIK